MTTKYHIENVDGMYAVCSESGENVTRHERWHEAQFHLLFANTLSEGDLAQAIMLDSDLLQSCLDTAEARHQKVYLYWSPTGLNWQSTIHFLLVPPQADHIVCHPTGGYSYVKGA